MNVSQINHTYHLYYRQIIPTIRDYLLLNTILIYKSKNRGPNRILSISYELQIRMAALNEPYTGDLQGIRGADFACYKEARRSGHQGTFKAFLSAR